MKIYFLSVVFFCHIAVLGRDNHPLTLPFCHEMMTPGGTDTEVLNERDIDLLKGMIRDLIHSDETGCTDDRRKDFIASYVRLAWHDVATWDPDTQTGGAHARMRFPSNPEHPSNEADNAGFEDYMEYLDYIHNFFGDRISLSDLWVLTALTAIEFGGGPTIPWRWGRTDEWDEDVGYSGRLPHAWKAKEDTGELDDVWLMEHLVGIMERLEFEDPVKALVVLCGAHNLGGPRPFQTGMTPGWLFEPIPWTPVGIYFHNAFYSELLWQRWWDSEAESPEVHMTVHADNRTIMFYSDFALLWSEESTKLVHHYATDLGAFYTDFVDYFSRLLEKGYADDALHKITPAYMWDLGEWGMCSEFCGGGEQHRDVTCISYPSMSVMADEEMCLSDRYGGPKPSHVQPCNNQACLVHVWAYSDWTECDRSCGGGIQMRDVHCTSSASGDHASEEYCSDLTVPQTYQACSVDSCGYWQQIPGTEGFCDMPCENAWIVEDFPLYRQLWTGESTSQFQCVKEYYNNPRVMPDEYCDEYEKPETVACISRFCEQALPHWRATQWSDCDAECDSGVQIREVTCWGAPHDQSMRSGIKQLEDEACENAPYYKLELLKAQYVPPGSLPAMPPQWGPQPAASRICNSRPCRSNMKIAGKSKASSSSRVSGVGVRDSANPSSKSKNDGNSNDAAAAHDDVVSSSNERGSDKVIADKDSVDVAELEADNTVLIAGLSVGAFVLVGLGFGARSWYRKREKRRDYSPMSNDEMQLMNKASREDDSIVARGSYQNKQYGSHHI